VFSFFLLNALIPCTLVKAVDKNNLEVMLRCALKPFEDQTEHPNWVTRSRKTYPLILEAFGDESIFEAKINLPH
jgi:hypothetical protein